MTRWFRALRPSWPPVSRLLVPSQCVPGRSARFPVPAALDRACGFRARLTDAVHRRNSAFSAAPGRAGGSTTIPYKTVSSSWSGLWKATTGQPNSRDRRLRLLMNSASSICAYLLIFPKRVAELQHPKVSGPAAQEPAQVLRDPLRVQQ